MNMNPILANKLTIHRYRLDFEKGDLSITDFMKSRFDQKDETPIETKAGFVDLNDPIESYWNPLCAALHPFIAIGLRIDRRTVPGKTLELETEKRIKVELKKQNDALSEREQRIKEEGLVNPTKEEPKEPKITKSRRREIKEQAKLSLISRTPPKPKYIGVVYREDKQTLYVVGASEGDLGILEGQIRHILSDKGTKKNEYTLERMSATTLGDSVDISGADFLTKLWTEGAHKILNCSWEFTDSVSVTKEKDSEEITAKSKGAAHYETINKAIAEGAHITKSSMLFSDEDEDAPMAWTCVLSSDLSVTGWGHAMYIAGEARPDDVPGLVLERMYLIERFFTLLDLLLSVYLRELGFSWNKVLPRDYQDMLKTELTPGELEEYITTTAKEEWSTWVLNTLHPSNPTDQHDLQETAP